MIVKRSYDRMSLEELFPVREQNSKVKAAL